jgi:hypothetical protein
VSGAGPKISIMRLMPVAALVVLTVAPLAACADDSADSADAATAANEPEDGDAGEDVVAEQSGTPQTVDCPADATEVDLPAEFPAPLPEGAIVVAVQERDDDRTVVTAVVPAAEPDVLVDLQAAYPEAGLTLTEGETEERDAESNFTGDGVTGRWGIRELTDCESPATRIDLVVRRS